MLLKKGSTGDDVKKLQNRLGLTADGVFGSGTEAQVKTWQAQNGLVADGIVGDATWAKLFPPSSAGFNLTDAQTKLKGHIPDGVIAQIPAIPAITNSLRLAHFLAQCAHESSVFTVVYENLNYSADGLKATFPSYFPGQLSESYARNPEKIGARVYADRMGNGNEASGDGYTFRGRGYIQLTGKSNYASFGKSVGEDTVANPDLVATRYPLASAGFFFDTNNIWTVCDGGSTDSVITSVTKKVNGGTNGLADRTKLFNEYYAILS
ncbi:MAG: peptidoglycan-binding protein [Methylobacter tundripaludum]|nr:peptidoglycan-binding protein [Methylobacter tundripaludum]